MVRFAGTPRKWTSTKPSTDPTSAYPDGLITDEALRQLDDLGKQTAKKPFFLAVGIIRPHLPFGAPLQYVKPYLKAELPPTPHPLKPSGKTTWHGSGEFMKYNRWKRNPNTDAAFALEVRRHYAGCVTYADALVGRILAKLDQLKLRDDTISHPLGRPWLAPRRARHMGQARPFRGIPPLPAHHILQRYPQNQAKPPARWSRPWTFSPPSATWPDWTSPTFCKGSPSFPS